MIQVCPRCGHDLPEALANGLTHCCHCGSVFDSSVLNTLLSAAWLVRKNRYTIDQLRINSKIDEGMAILVSAFVGDNGYSHEEFYKFLTKIGVASKSYMSVDT